jgi:hypothetical protein
LSPVKIDCRALDSDASTNVEFPSIFWFFFITLRLRMF